jgi:hypothetical protein
VLCCASKTIRKAPVGSGAVYANGPAVTRQAHLTEPAKGWVERQPREKNRGIHPACLLIQVYHRPFGVANSLILFLVHHPDEKDASPVSQISPWASGHDGHMSCKRPRYRLPAARYATHIRRTDGVCAIGQYHPDEGPASVSVAPQRASECTDCFTYATVYSLAQLPSAG